MGTCFLLVGPSGAGKNTVQAKLLERFPELVNAKGMWTRPHRPGEDDDTADSVSVTEEEFMRCYAAGELTAVNEVHGYHYGTLITSFLDPIHEGKSVIRIVTDEGAEAVLRDLGDIIDIVTIYLAIPIYVTVERLLARGDAPEDIVRRVKTAEAEMERFRANGLRWDYVIQAWAPLDYVVEVVAATVTHRLAATV